MTCPSSSASATKKAAPKKKSDKNWNACKTTSDCNAGWSCANTVVDQTICVNNTMYAKGSYELTNNACSVPSTAPMAYSYYGYTCPPYGGANATNSTSSTTPAAPAPVLNMYSCDISRTCNRVIHHATGQNVTDAMCYLMELENAP